MKPHFLHDTALRRTELVFIFPMKGISVTKTNFCIYVIQPTRQLETGERGPGYGQPYTQIDRYVSEGS